MSRTSLPRRTVYLKPLLPGREAQAAARLLYCILLLRKRRGGVSLAFLARRFGLGPSSLVQAYREAACRVSLETGGPEHEPVDWASLQREWHRYGPVVDRLEEQAVRDLADPKVEALIRGTFTADPEAVVLFRPRHKSQFLDR